MKGFLILLVSMITTNTSFKAQIEPVKFDLEKTTFKYSFNSVIYKSRLSGASNKENNFRNFSFFTSLSNFLKRILINFIKSFFDNLLSDLNIIKKI